MTRVPRIAAVRLQSERLVLDPLRVQDADELEPLLNDVALHRFIGGEPPDGEELRDRFERQVGERSPDGRQSWLNWTVRLRSSGLAVGITQATVSISGRDRVAELAWIIATRHQGRGLGTEAAGMVAEWLREQRLARLRAHIHPRHDASGAIAAAIGLLPTDVIVDGELRWEWSARA